MLVDPVTTKLAAQSHLPVGEWFDAFATVKVGEAKASEPLPIQIKYVWDDTLHRRFSFRERYAIPITKNGKGARVYLSLPDGQHLTWFALDGCDTVQAGGTYVIIPGDNANGW